jgi:hypothetical protein
MKKAKIPLRLKSKIGDAIHLYIGKMECYADGHLTKEEFDKAIDEMYDHLWGVILEERYDELKNVKEVLGGEDKRSSLLDKEAGPGVLAVRQAERRRRSWRSRMYNLFR